MYQNSKTMTTSSADEPRNPYSPVAFVHPKMVERGSYVQRWKTLRDRNKNLPKIDFSTKTLDQFKRQNSKAHLGIARSLTLDSMKLPSISNGSITNGSTYTTKSNKETGTKKVGIQETESILSDNKSTLIGNLSKSLPNVANIGTSQELTKTITNSYKHKYEKIAQQKRLIKRKHDQKEVQKEDRHDSQPLEQSGIYQFEITSEFPTSADVTKRFSKNTIGTILENETLSAGRHSRQTRFRLENDPIGRRSRRKKWRDNCKCMRCEIMHRQYEEKDDHYTKWGIYPCQQHLSRQKYFNQYFYDSD